MKNKTILKRLLSISLSLLMIMAIIVPSQVFASNPSEWKTDKATGMDYDSAGVIQGYTGNAENIVIPAKLGNVTIKKIGSSVFINHEEIKTVTLPNGLTAIGDNTFGNCPNLKTINFPSSLQVIDAYAFDRCSSLEGVTIPSGVKVIGEGAFLFCKSITKMNIPSGIKTLGTGAFQGISITSIVIPSSVTKITGALFGQTLLKSVEIPKTVKTIEEQAFAECPDLTSVTIPKTVKTIGHDAFADCPNLTIYGENDSAAQIYATNNNIKFVDKSEASGSSGPVVKTDAIVVPADTNVATATAVPSKTQLSLNGEVKNLAAYTINGSDYFKITDLGLVLAGSELEFSPAYHDFRGFMQLKANFESKTKSVLTPGDGTEKSAIRVYPRIYSGLNDISGAISVYSINGEEYYKFSDTMNIINCGILKDSKTGIIELKPRMNYEPLNSPVFAPVPKGDASYMKLQKALYDAYLNGKEEVEGLKVTVPDNTVLYIPRGVSYGGNVTLGNNSSFIVKGEWKAEYPDRSLKPKSSSTKNALYAYSFNPVSPLSEYSSANNNVVFVKGSNHFQWGDLRLASAKISYGNITNGVQSIILNVTRDKRDPATCVFVYFHVKGGESYGQLINNVTDSVDLTPLLATVVGKNIGKNAVIDRVNVQNANGVSLSKDIALPVNWTITTSGLAPTEAKTVPTYGNSLIFNGLSNHSYIAKYNIGDETNFGIISPKNNYTVAQLVDFDEGGATLTGDTTNILLFTGKKVEGAKVGYAFLVSPFSENIAFKNSLEF